jgi:hypothetical protein
MATFTLEKAFDLFTGVDSLGPATRFVQEKQQEQLACDVEELANIRFSIVITSKWANSPDEEPERRKELRDELDSLRYRYYDKIDRIAMAYGVPEAMIARDEVERRITIELTKNLAEAVAADEGEERFEI